MELIHGQRQSAVTTAAASGEELTTAARERRKVSFSRFILLKFEKSFIFLSLKTPPFLYSCFFFHFQFLVRKNIMLSILAIVLQE